MKYSRKNLLRTVILNAAIDPKNIAAFALSIFFTVNAVVSQGKIALIVCTVASLSTYIALVVFTTQRKAKQYGALYFSALHRYQMDVVESQLENLEDSPLAKDSRSLLKMYWDMRLSGNLSDSRKDTLADASERYFQIMTTSLNAINRLPDDSQAIQIEKKKLAELSESYRSALISECVRQTSAGNTSQFNELISELESIKFSNEYVTQ
ncbi:MULTISPECIES: hypothetical protein [Vibrio]|uniref:hypothetical protein n=1 Tax=Vibrio TaxID=662 RepID=UPI001B8130D9|nr:MULTISPECIES: hypothetical protein [Vibrio]BDP38331.1 hypothetical protein VA208B3_47020 [Vibrio alginolyticus]MDF5646555.1 hypothetical protein [Vibrio parahaemolyticus]MDF5666187.1 hypothetical protein [Vibrio parahaemolyticus]WKV19442.1 hypothetical protein [Vibrio parahaemolyticus]BDP33425.1 hypothetical protein VV208B2_45050 [Vibrio vulnificus]